MSSVPTTPTPRPTAARDLTAEEMTAAGAVVHTIAYARQHVETRISGPAPNPSHEFWLPAPSHPGYARFLDQFVGWAKSNQDTLVHLLPSLAASPTHGVDDDDDGQHAPQVEPLVIRLHQFVATIVAAKRPSEEPWVAFRDWVDYVLKAHVNGRTLSFGDFTVTPLHPLAPRRGDQSWLPYLIFPWSAEHRPFTSRATTSAIRHEVPSQLPKSPTGNVTSCPPKLSRALTSPTRETATNMHGQTSRPLVLPPTLFRASTTAAMPVLRSIARPTMISGPLCRHPPSTLNTSWLPAYPDRQRKCCCLARTIERAIDADASVVTMVTLLEWVLADNSEERRDCLLALVEYTTWLSKPWLLALREVGHMFGAEDPNSPKWALDVARAASQRVEPAVLASDPLRAGFDLILTIRQDALRALLANHGSQVSQETIGKALEWAEGTGRRHVDSWYDALAILNEYCRFCISTSNDAAANDRLGRDLMAINKVLVSPEVLEVMTTARVLQVGESSSSESSSGSSHDRTATASSTTSSARGSQPSAVGEGVPTVASTCVPDAGEAAQVSKGAEV